MQYRWPVGPGPSSNTWPRWPPQARQTTSVRTIPWLLSRSELDRVGDGRLGEARPAGTGVELGRTVEQHRPATGAAVTAIFVIVDICP